MKRLFPIILAFMLCFAMPVFTLASPYSPPFEVQAQSAYMVNLDSNMLIYNKNSSERVNSNALAQMMTVILALERIENPEETMITMAGYIQDEMNAKNSEYGRIGLGGLYRAETLSAYNLIWAVMLQSANEAAMMLADHMGGGSIAYFVQLMNHRAKELGANNTNFTSPTGLPDDESYTTAYDMYLLGRHAMTLDGYDEFISQTSKKAETSRVQSIEWYTNNSFLKTTNENYNPGITTLRVAFDAADGKSSAITYAKKNGYTYMAVLLNCTSAEVDAEKSDNQRAIFTETNRIYEWSFDTFKVKTLLEKGKSFEEIPLNLCWQKDFLRVMSADNFSALIPDAIESTSIRYELVLPDFIDAPVMEGDIIGEVKLILSDEVVGRVGIAAAESVESSNTLIFLEKVDAVVDSFPFKFIVVFLILSIITYITVVIVRNRNNRRYKGAFTPKKRT